MGDDSRGASRLRLMGRRTCASQVCAGGVFCGMMGTCSTYPYGIVFCEHYEGSSRGEHRMDG